MNLTHLHHFALNWLWVSRLRDFIPTSNQHQTSTGFKVAQRRRAYNLFTYASSIITATLAKQGYSSTIPLIGILCEPQTELEVYPDAVKGIKQENATIVARYDLSGRRITAPQRGINIIRLSDGTTRKILVR